MGDAELDCTEPQEASGRVHREPRREPHGRRRRGPAYGRKDVAALADGELVVLPLCVVHHEKLERSGTPARLALDWAP
jgi:hypothetical protein